MQSIAFFSCLCVFCAFRNNNPIQLIFWGPKSMVVLHTFCSFKGFFFHLLQDFALLFLKLFIMTRNFNNFYYSSTRLISVNPNFQNSIQQMYATLSHYTWWCFKSHVYVHCTFIVFVSYLCAMVLATEILTQTNVHARTCCT